MASASGTKLFASRAAARLSSSPRTLGSLFVTPFGFGAYRLADRGTGPGAGSAKALKAALTSGLCNVIDTSVSYADGGSEQVVGDVLADVLAAGTVKREEVVVVTKVGHVRAGASPGPPPGEARIEIPSGGGGANKVYSLHPEWIRAEVEASASRLGTAPDVVLLHNPEFLLADSFHRRRPRAAAHDAFHRVVGDAFGELEKLVESGAIGHCYGVSTNPCGTWWSVSGRRNGYEAPSFPRLLADAAAAGGGVDDHRFRVLQVPLNILELGAAMAHYDPALPSDESVAAGLLPSALRLAKEHGVGVMANRPIHAIPPVGLSTDWREPGSFLKLRDEAGNNKHPTMALLRSVLSDAAVGAGVPKGEEASMQRLALWVAASVPNVDVALSGALRPSYMADLAEVSGWPRLEEAQVWELFNRVQDCVAELTDEPAGF